MNKFVIVSLIFASLVIFGAVSYGVFMLIGATILTAISKGTYPYTDDWCSINDGTVFYICPIVGLASVIVVVTTMLILLFTVCMIIGLCITPFVIVWWFIRHRKDDQCHNQKPIVGALDKYFVSSDY